MKNVPNEELMGYVHSLCENLRSEYTIREDSYKNQNIKRGLRNDDDTGVKVGVTRIGSVLGYVMEDGKPIPTPGYLYYRNYEIIDIVKSHAADGTFGYEEVAYLLLMGRLPNAEQFHRFKAILSSAQQLPPDFIENTILKAPSRDLMNMLSRSVLGFYSYDNNPDDVSIDNLMRQSIELIGRFPIVIADAYAAKRYYFDGESLYLHKPRESLSISENFLRMVRKDKAFTKEEANLLDLMLMLHAEHGGGNNSTFSCRVLSSTGTDTYSAIAAAVGSLKGPLHGGANAQVMSMFKDIKENVRNLTDDEELTAYLGKILNKEAGDHSGKIYGLGHAVYTKTDPRALLVKEYAGSMAIKKGRTDDFELMQSIERLGVPLIMERKNLNTPICANVDMYSGLVYSMLGIPEELYTPLFAMARIVGWCAHRIEEVVSGGKIIRPAYRAEIQSAKYVPANMR